MARRTRRRNSDGTDAHGVGRLLQLHRDGASMDTIAAALDAEGFCTPAGRPWHRASVARLISEWIRRSVGPSGRRPGRQALHRTRRYPEPSPGPVLAARR